MPTKGFAFRASSGFVTDGPNDTFVLPTDVYPVVRNGVTFGWDTQPNALDRDVTIPKIAGIHFDNAGTVRTFRVDLPFTGPAEVRIGQGDWTNTGLIGQFILRGPGPLFTSVDRAAQVGVVVDATSAPRPSGADWAVNNAVQAVTVPASGTLSLSLQTALSSLWTIDYFSITGGAAAPAEDDNLAQLFELLGEPMPVFNKFVPVVPAADNLTDFTYRKGQSPGPMPCRAIYVGGTGDVTAVTQDGVPVTFAAVPAGKYLVGLFRRVNAAGTTATLMHACYID